MSEKLLVRVAYNGAIFSGMAKQPNLKTIEGIISERLARYGYRKKIWYLSRTDRGVHAVYQIISIREVDRSILEAINKRLPKGIYAYSYAKTKSTKIRSLFGDKTYLYIAPNHGEDPKKLLYICSKISGKEVNYRALVKSPQRYGDKSLMKLDLKCVFGDRFIFFYVKGKYFLWQQVRRLITFLKSYSIGNLSDEAVRKILKGEFIKKGVAPAPAEGLILWNVDNDLNWKEIIRENVIRRLILEKTKLFSRLFFKKWVL